MYKILSTLSTLLLLFSISAYAAGDANNENADQKNSDILVFDDTMLEDELVYPDWFKLSLGDLNDDLEKAKNSFSKPAWLIPIFRIICANTMISSPSTSNWRCITKQTSRLH